MNSGARPAGSETAVAGVVKLYVKDTHHASRILRCPMASNTYYRQTGQQQQFYKTAYINVRLLLPTRSNISGKRLGKKGQGGCRCSVVLVLLQMTGADARCCEYNILV